MALIDQIANPDFPSFLESYARGKRDLQVEEATNIDTLRKTLDFQEKLAELPITSIEREKRKRVAQHGLETVEQDLQFQDTQKQLQNQSFRLETLAQTIGEVKDEESYQEFLEENKGLPEIQEFFDEEGNAVPYSQARGRLQSLRETGINTAGHIRDLQLAQIRAQQTGQPSAGFADVNVSNFERLSSMAQVEKVIEDLDLNLGSMDDSTSDARFIADQMASVVNMVTRANADKGITINPGAVQQRILDIASRSLQEESGALAWLGDLVGGRPAKIDRRQFINDLTNTFGLSEGQKNQLDKTTEKETKTLEFKNAAQAEKAAKEGKIKPGDRIVVDGVAGTWK